MKKFIVVLTLLTSMFLGATQKPKVLFYNKTPFLISNLSTPVSRTIKSLKYVLKKQLLSPYKINNLEPVFFKSVKIDNTEIFKFRYTYKGLDVVDAFSTISVKNGVVYKITNSASNISIDLKNLLPKSKIVKIVSQKVFPDKIMPKNYSAKKQIRRIGNSYVPVYEVYFAPTSLMDTRFYIVNAKTGMIIYSSNHTSFDKSDNVSKDRNYNVKPLGYPIPDDITPPDEDIAVPDLTTDSFPDVDASIPDSVPPVDVDSTVPDTLPNDTDYTVPDSVPTDTDYTVPDTIPTDTDYTVPDTIPMDSDYIPNDFDYPVSDALADEDSSIVSDTSIVDSSPDTELPDEDVGQNFSDLAKVYRFNPVRTPDLTEVTLSEVSPFNDYDLKKSERGFLTSSKDETGIRRIKAYNCPNKGEEIDAGKLLGVGMSVMVPICTPTQMANKIQNGSFIYNDCKTGGEFDATKMTPDKIDKCAEISMYYHASKEYDYIRSLKTDFNYLLHASKENALSVIGNFQIVDMSDLNAIINGSAKLGPMDNAFFSPPNPTMTKLLSGYGIKGDMLVFGQGTKADFAFDGDVVYHEFGHAIIFTTGLDSADYPDKYGLSHEPASMHEGLADTFSFIMTGDACTGEYASKGIIDMYKAKGQTVEMDRDGDYYCMRYAKHPYNVFEDSTGEEHWDGQPLLAVNWEIMQMAFNDKLGANEEEQKANFTKLILKTLYSLGTPKGNFHLWAQTLMSEVSNDDNFKVDKDKIKALLTKRNFFEEKRARSGNKDIKVLYLTAGKAQQGGTSSGITTEEDGSKVGIAPAYIQVYYDVPEDFEGNALKITGTAKASASGLGGIGGGTVDIKVYARKGSPVEYKYDSNGKATITFDERTEVSKNEWIINNVKPKSRYYFQFVNYGTAAGVVQNIHVESYTAEPPITDEDSVDEDSEIVETETVSETEVTPTDSDDSGLYKKSSSGCSCSLISLF